MPVDVSPGSNAYRPVALRRPRTSIMSSPRAACRMGRLAAEPEAGSLSTIEAELSRISCMVTSAIAIPQVMRSGHLPGNLVNLDNADQHIPGATMLISAHEAARRLGVKPATLYAYVSRELLRSAPGPDSRSRRYYAEDVERLRRSRHAGPRSGKPPKPFDSLMPVLDTTISLIENGRLYYRGSDAVKLAETADLETIAQILWEQAEPENFRVGQMQAQLRRLLGGRHHPLMAMDRARMILSELTMHDVAALDTSPLAVRRTGARLVAVLTGSVTRTMPSGLAIHEELGRVWKLDASAVDLVRRCLVLIADHELNASTYVGRCIASTGATPYAVVLGALGALSGPKHGGETGRAPETCSVLPPSACSAASVFLASVNPSTPRAIRAAATSSVQLGAQDMRARALD